MLWFPVPSLLSVAIGQAIVFLPKVYTHYAAVGLFLLFGIKLLYEASRMTASTTDEVLGEAKDAIEVSEKNLKGPTNGWAILLESFILTFLAEWGDRTQIATVTEEFQNVPLRWLVAYCSSSLRLSQL